MAKKRELEERVAELERLAKALLRATGTPRPVKDHPYRAGERRDREQWWDLAEAVGIDVER